MESDASGSISIMMSMSLSGRLSPRATEPNSAACATPRARKSASHAFSFPMISSRFMDTILAQDGLKITSDFCTSFLHKKSPCPSRAWFLCIILDFCTGTLGALAPQMLQKKQFCNLNRTLYTCKIKFIPLSVGRLGSYVRRDFGLLALL